MRIPSALAGLAFLVSCAPAAAPELQAFDSPQTERVVDARPVVLLHLDVEALPPLPSADVSMDERRAQLDLHAAALDKEVQALSAALPSGVEWVRSYRHLPVVVVRITDADPDLAGLEALSGVVRAELEPVEKLFDAQSLGLIHQPTAVAAGFDGAGTSVVVLDTGADHTHADLGSCTAVGTPAGCRVVYADDLAADDGSLDASGHGTNVSAIVANVAPAADIIALDVFTGSSGFGSDILEGLDWVVDNQATYDVASVNLSLGSGRHTQACTNAYTSAIDVVRAAGVSVVIASGNDGYTNAVASPACNEAALTVGAVYDAARSPIGYSACSDLSPVADQVTCFSNASDVLDVLSPGALVTAGGHTMAGTSQAAPHVAGAMAVLRAAAPDAALDDLEQQLLDTGTPLLDARNNLTFPRLDLAAATAAGPPPEPEPEPEPEPVDASIAIESDAPATATNRVSLTLAAPGATRVCVSNNDRCTRWRNFAPQMDWRLPTQNGEHTVYATFIDDTGTLTGPVTDTILLDRRNPDKGSLFATPGPEEATLTWSGFADAGTGIAMYRVMIAPNRAPACNAAVPAWEGPESQVTVSGLSNGTRYGVAVCALDGVGNLSRAATAAVTPIPESDGPVGSLTINDGAAFTRSRTVSLALSAVDASEVTSACVSAQATCSRFSTLRAVKSWRLGNRQGVHTVHARYRDEWGTEGETVAASITLDSVGPEGGTATATPLPGAVELSWAGFTDEGAGLASYVVSRSATSAPPSKCRRGRVYLGADTSVVVGDLPIDRATGFRICPVDAVGNVGTGVTIVAAPGSESTPPVGSLILGNGSGWSALRSVTATLHATDASGVTRMCLSTNETCSNWVPYRDTRRVTLARHDAEQTVRAWYRDAWGNTSAPVSQTVTLDTDRPSDGTATASGRSGAVTLDWSGFTDVGSGVVEYVVAEVEGDGNPSCNRPLWTGADTTLDLTGREDGTTYTYRVCAQDAAGNRSSGVLVTGRPAPEFVAPTGTVLANGGEPYTASRDVDVALTATDDSGVAEMCLTARDIECTSWEPFAEQGTVRVSSTRNLQTVYAYFKDVWGNVSAAATTTITLDATPPSNGDVDGVYVAADAIDLTWSGFADSGSGIASYIVVGAVGTAPPACDTPPLMESTGTAALIPVPVSDSFAFRVCAVDQLGNVSSGARRVVRSL